MVGRLELLIVVFCFIFSFPVLAAPEHPLALPWLFLRFQATTASARTYRKLPLGLPQRADAVVVRHAALKGLSAHDPSLAVTGTGAEAGHGGDLVGGRHGQRHRNTRYARRKAVGAGTH